MATAPSSALSPVATPEATNPDGISTVYANNMGIAATVTDVQLIFTQMRQASGSDGKLRPENAVTAMVAIPIGQVPQLIAGLSQMLQHHKTVIEAQLAKQAPKVKN